MGIPSSHHLRIDTPAAAPYHGIRNVTGTGNEG